MDFSIIWVLNLRGYYNREVLNLNYNLIHTCGCYNSIVPLINHLYTCSVQLKHKLASATDTPIPTN
jgi:hypothetical protein